MDGKKIAIIVLLVLGIVIVVLSLVADPIGIGGSSRFGKYQTVGVIVGAILTVVGLVLKVKK